MARMKADATIPEEIIVEIVTRLPIKTVGRCRCVCKRWCSLFSDPKFAKSHMQSAIERRALSYRLVLLTDVYESPYLDLGELKKSSVRLGQLKAPFKKQGRGLCFLGHCNGLVACFTFEPRMLDRFDSLFIWNPSTGFYKEITVPWKGFGLPWGVDKRGFGHVSGTNDYKVVLKVKYSEIDIFSFRTLTWNSIKFPVDTYQDNGVLLREALHWLAYEDPDPDNDDREADSVESWEQPIFVFALDLAKEEFQKMQGPCTKLRICYGPYGSRLGVSSEGCLYVMNLSGSLGIDYAVDFWVMREYGNSETWTRSYSLRFSNEPDYPIYRLEPILLMENCAVVMNMPDDDDKPGGDKSKMLAEADMNMVHVDSKHENATSLYILHSNILHSFPPDMNVYEESLSGDYEEGEEGQKALISSTSHKA